MDDSNNNFFNWIYELECPTKLCKDSVKESLCQGVFEFLWDDFATSIHPQNRICTKRKDILLEKLKYQLSDPVIESAKRVSEFSTKNKTINHEIDALERQYQEQNTLLGKKAQELKKLKFDCSLTRTKQLFLKSKYDSMRTQLQESKSINSICQHFMPNNKRDVNDKCIRDCLDIISNLSKGADKKEVSEKILDLIGPIAISALWQQLYQIQSFDTDQLLKMKTIEIAKTVDHFEGTIDHDIAEASGKHVQSIMNRLLYNIKIGKHQKSLINLITQIEEKSKDEENVAEWLMLTLEIRKLHSFRINLDNEIDQMNTNCEELSRLTPELYELMRNIQTIDLEIEKYVGKTERSLLQLKSAVLTIEDIRNKLNDAWLRIVQVKANRLTSLLKPNLNTELRIFNYSLDTNALRKILLKGEIKSCRYITSCTNHAFTSPNILQNSQIVSHFSSTQLPIYSLINCFKNLIENLCYKKYQPKDMNVVRSIHIDTFSVSKEIETNILGMLSSSQRCNKEAQEEIKKFHQIMKNWRQQNIQEVMTLFEYTIDGGTFKQWLQRYDMLIYMSRKIQRSFVK